MTGHDYEDDEPETFRPAPHPDDRLWRHPAEIAAMHAATSEVAAVEVPAAEVAAVEVADRPVRLHRVALVAAGIVVVGAAALSLGIASGRDTATTATATATTTSPAATSTSPIAAIAAPPSADAPTGLYGQVATSLPRIQAATSGEMREGSGMFVTDDGHIATSAHLVASAEYVLAWTDDGQRWKAEIVATDPVSDIAVLQIASDSWPAIPLTSNVDLSQGQPAHAIDHDDRQVAAGSVTMVGARVELDQPAALPGSAIFDDDGQVIAMATATTTGQTHIAVPAWMIEQVAVDLISAGETSHTWLGLLIDPEANPNDMVKVSEVVAGSPAAAAGIRVGDLIDSLNGVDTPNWGTLYRQVQETPAGGDAVLTVTRNGSRRIIIATVEAVGD